MKRILLFILFSFNLQAQVVTWSPLFPSRNDTITVLFNAQEGNRGLVGATEVYAHTGVITNKSVQSSDWRYLKTTWGYNTPETRLQQIDTDLWQLCFHIQSYYNVPFDETIKQLAFVFRKLRSLAKPEYPQRQQRQWLRFDL
ncbi:hypothetical protein GF406_03060 [candidate division KSB1 bacterium]|nr:hypothetical protein [candidate division KSB1 bacterium]